MVTGSCHPASSAATNARSLPLSDNCASVRHAFKTFGIKRPNAAADCPDRGYRSGQDGDIGDSRGRRRHGSCRRKHSSHSAKHRQNHRSGPGHDNRSRENQIGGWNIEMRHAHASKLGTEVLASSNANINARESHAAVKLERRGSGLRACAAKMERLEIRDLCALLHKGRSRRRKPGWRALSSKFSARAGQAALEAVIALAMILAVTSVFIKQITSITKKWDREVKKPWFVESSYR